MIQVRSILWAPDQWADIILAFQRPVVSQLNILANKDDILIGRNLITWVRVGEDIMLIETSPTSIIFSYAETKWQKYDLKIEEGLGGTRKKTGKR